MYQSLPLDIQARHSATISISCILHYNRLVILLTYGAASQLFIFLFSGISLAQEADDYLTLTRTVAMFMGDVIMGPWYSIIQGVSLA